MPSNHLPVYEAVKKLEDMLPLLNKTQLKYLESLLGNLYHKARDAQK